MLDLISERGKTPRIGHQTVVTSLDVTGQALFDRHQVGLRLLDFGGEVAQAGSGRHQGRCHLCALLLAPGNDLMLGQGRLAMGELGDRGVLGLQVEESSLSRRGSLHRGLLKL